jgi:hypothetical protein
VGCWYGQCFRVPRPAAASATTFSIPNC